MKIAVIGAGAWGTTLADLSGKAGHDVLLWCREPEVMESVSKEAVNSVFLPGIKLHPSVKATTDLPSAVRKAEIIICVVPTQFLRNTLTQADKSEWNGKTVVSATKGIEQESLMFPSDIISSVTGINDIAVLSGPNLSKEIAQGLPAASVAASRDIRTAGSVQKAISTDKFRIYTAKDVKGVETGGALKNVIAIAAGICDGMGYGNNAKSAVIVRGISEISRLGVALGASPETFAGLSGIGDLITTCQSSLSRNHYVGEQLATGKKLDGILKNMRAVAEGIDTSVSAVRLSEKTGIEMPISKEVYLVLHKGKSPSEAMKDLLSRKLKKED